MHFKRFKGQNYEDLKKSHNSGNLFVDNIFLANSSSLAYSDSSKYDHYDIKWKRPSEIVGDPMFLVEGFDRIDINQGQIGNCWFLAGRNIILIYKIYFIKKVFNSLIDKSVSRYL